MKVNLVCLILLIIGILGVSFVLAPKPVHAQLRPRFEHLLTEDGPDSGLFKAYHDRETGQEIVCYERKVDLGWSPSCWLTGRNWK